MMLPWILMLIGEPAEMKMSEAFFSAMIWSSFSMNISCASRLIAPQQLIDARFGPGLRVDLLDDDRAVETIPAISPGQVAGNDYGARRNAPVGDFARRAIVDFGALADVDPHRDHRALADDDTLDHLAAGADEAVVLDDGGVGLQRLEHSADPHASREVDVLADL